MRRCDWCEVKHLPSGTVNEEFENGKFMCLYCQILVTDNMAKTSLAFVEISVAQRVAHHAKTDQAKRERKASERMRAISNEPGWVYYVRQGDLIKIGYTDNIKQRMRAYAPTGELLAVHPGTLETEKDMHRKFAVALDQGREWFRQRPELMAHIAETVNQFGDPSVFVYKYRKHLRDGDQRQEPKYLTRL